MRVILAVWILFFCSAGLTGQSYSNSVLVNVKGHSGFIIAHAKDLRPVSQTLPWGIETEIAWQLQTEKVWQYTYSYPKVGFSFFYTNFNNPQVLGSSFAFYPFVEPILQAEKKWSYFMRFGAGPNFLNNVYDSIDNPTNTFYSSPVSFVVILGAGATVKIFDNVELKAGANFNHISNGGIKNPNRGINFPTIFAGIDYRIHSAPFVDYSKNENLDLTPRNRWWELTGLATAKTDIKGYAKYAVYGLNFGYYQVFGRLSAWNTSIEFVNDLADKEEIRRLSLSNNGEPVDHRYGAVLGGYNLLLGVFRFSFQLGAYVYSPFDRGDPVYQRYGINVLFFDKINLGINLKASRHIADYMDMRIGIIFD